MSPRRLQRLAVRAGSGRLRGPALAAHRALAHALALALTWRLPAASAYLAGSFTGPDAVPGVSDVDVVVLAAAPGGAAVRARRARLLRLPGLRRVAEIAVAEPRELAMAADATLLTAGDAIFAGPGALADEAGVLTKPALGAPGAHWQRLCGPDRRPAGGERDAAARGVIAWLLAQYWWRHAFAACAAPGRPHVPYLAAKLPAEAERIAGWMRTGADPGRGAAARADLATGLDALVAWTERIAAALPAGGVGTPVRLRGGEPATAGGAPAGALPLADWRARAAPPLPDEVLLPRRGAVTPPGLMQVAAGARRGEQPALRAGALLLLPSADPFDAGLLRAVQCAASDPVSFAVLDGRDVAVFPAGPGWCAEDAARRAVTELRARARVSREDRGRALAVQLALARAEAFAASLAAGAPELGLTVGAGAAQLAEQRPALAGALAEGAAAHRAWRAGGPAPPAALVRALGAVAG